MRDDDTRIRSKRKMQNMLLERRSVLKVLQGYGAGRTILLGEKAVVAGRADDSDLVLDDPSASRRHFEVVQQPGGFILRDLGSTNGTLVNHVSVAECRLSDGDIVTIGDTEIVFLEHTELLKSG